jgi:hypothetical protein
MQATVFCCLRFSIQYFSQLILNKDRNFGLPLHKETLGVGNNSLKNVNFLFYEFKAIMTEILAFALL